MEAPPHFPPITFHHKRDSVVRSACMSVFFFALLVWRGFDIVGAIRAGQSYLFDAVMAVIMVIAIAWCVYLVANKAGGKIEIADGTLRFMRRNGTVWQWIRLAEIVVLEKIVPKGESRASSYYVGMDKKRGVWIGTDIEDLPTLLALIEDRTGKKFVQS